MHSIAALSIRTTKWRKQVTCVPTDQRIRKMWYIHIIEEYSALKSKEILIPAPTWRNLEDSRLGEKQPVTKSHKRKNIA